VHERVPETSHLLHDIPVIVGDKCAREQPVALALEADIALVNPLVELTVLSSTAVLHLVRDQLLALVLETVLKIDEDTLHPSFFGLAR
jgi:hypothetical protein